mmetsp:Transcript_17587/g.36254  ORF Transcript_17587/g.36254 Transcript_17587/m.36254 type:complete len:206 (-) Transcript_17587:156-773(-)
MVLLVDCRYSLRYICDSLRGEFDVPNPVELTTRPLQSLRQLGSFPGFLVSVLMTTVLMATDRQQTCFHGCYCRYHLCCHYSSFRVDAVRVVLLRPIVVAPAVARQIPRLVVLPQNFRRSKEAIYHVAHLHRMQSQPRLLPVASVSHERIDLHSCRLVFCRRTSGFLSPRESDHGERRTASPPLERRRDSIAPHHRVSRLLRIQRK